MEHSEFHNDDLVGFFVSVPHDRIMEAITHFIVTYMTEQCAGQSLEDITFTVDISKQAKPGHRTIRGRTCKSNTTTHYFKLADLKEAVQFSLECSFFENMGEIYFQVRGSSIGSQCSPPICAIVVAFVEFQWLRSYKLKLVSDILFIRYVDNRLICLPTHIANQQHYHELLSLDFYGRPVELEECATQIFWASN